MKKKIILVSSLMILLVLSMPFMSTVQAQRDIPVSADPTGPILTPCDALWARFYLEVATTLGVAVSVIPAGGSLAWALLFAAGVLTADLYGQYNRLMELCGPRVASDEASLQSVVSVTLNLPVIMSTTETSAPVSAPINAPVSAR